MICFHRNLVHLSKPKQNGKGEVICTKCEKVMIKNIDKIMDRLQARNYLWCNRCGYELTLDSYIKEIEEGIYEYNCKRCTKRSVFDFRSGIIAEEITHE